MKTKTLKPNTDKIIKAIVTGFIRWQERVCIRLQRFTMRFSLRTQSIGYAMLLLPLAFYCIHVFITALIQLLR